MPTRRKTDSKGCYYQYGTEGKKYYYKPGDEKERERAKQRADRQGRAIKSSRR